MLPPIESLFVNDSAHDNQSNEDGGTVLESLESILESLQANQAQNSAPQFKTVKEPTPAFYKHSTDDKAAFGQAFTPRMRPPTPRLTILNDGDTNAGEMVWLREASTVIGRTSGHIRLPHDPLVSGTHAEIVREGTAAPYRWILRDLGSSNRTFVSCAKALMRPDQIIILGSRRLQFRNSAIAMPRPSTQNPSTVLADSQEVLASLWPSLVEITATPNPLEIPLRGASLSVGQPGYGNDIELDDPLIAQHHAQIVRQPSGQWRIESKRSTNGVWIQTSAIRLSSLCRFQCGEQRFLFEQ